MAKPKKNQPPQDKGSSDKPASSGEATTPQAAQVQLVSLAEIASSLRLPALQVRKMTQSGQIPAVKVEGEWRFNKDLVHQAIKKRSRGR